MNEERTSTFLLQSEKSVFFTLLEIIYNSQQQKRNVFKLEFNKGEENQELDKKSKYDAF